MALRRRQRAFIEEYLKCWNATEAAIRVGYSKRTAYSIGHENLNKPEIAEFIATRLGELKMSADEVIKRLTDMARGFDPLEYMDTVEIFDRDIYGQKYLKGLMLDADFERMKADGYGPLVKKVKNTSNGIEVEVYDAQFALDRLGRHHQLFTESIKHEVTGQITHKIDGFEDFLSKVYGHKNDSSQPDGARELPENG